MARTLTETIALARKLAIKELIKSSPAPPGHARQRPMAEKDLYLFALDVIAACEESPECCEPLEVCLQGADLINLKLVGKELVESIRACAQCHHYARSLGYSHGLVRLCTSHALRTDEALK